jgi:type II secretory pathway component PulF
MSAFYSLPVFLATFLGDQEEIGASGILIVILLLLSRAVPVPTSVNIFRAMGESSPLFTHTFPWASMGISLGAAGILFLAALKVVQTREY